MASYKVSGAALADIETLYEYSVLEFGERTADQYLDGLYERSQLLSENMSWGNDYGHIEPDLMRYGHRSHSIYYQIKSKTQILIVRVLGKRQDPARHI